MSGAQVIEAMLLRWGESPAGRTVTFLLPDDGTQHPFKGLKTGPSYGQRVALSVALISDDETQSPAPAQEPKPTKERRSWSGLPLSQQAAIRCGENSFQVFLGESSATGAAERVRTICGVASRGDIRKEMSSGLYWEQLDAQYRQWLNTNGAEHGRS